MIRKALAWILILAAATVCPVSPAKADVCPGINVQVHPIAGSYQKIAVSSTAVGLTLPTTGTLRMAIIMVEDNPIRYRDDGTNPTATNGTLVQANVGITVCGSAMGSFKAIRSSSDANISVLYYGN